jgi:hypothetical protein
VGGSTGLGSVVYAFTAMYELLNNSDLLADAKNAASMFTSDLIAADRSFDVMEGSAGAALGLLKLYRVTGDPSVRRSPSQAAANHTTGGPAVVRMGCRNAAKRDVPWGGGFRLRTHITRCGDWARRVHGCRSRMHRI